MKKIIIYSCICLWSFATSLHGQNTEGKKAPKRIECKLMPLQLVSKGMKKQYSYTSDSPTGNGIATPISLVHSASLNWSGYATLTSLNHPANGVVKNVSGAWVVPEVLPSEMTTYSSAWVGMDGYSNGTVEQIGTEHDWDGELDEQVNYAWFQMYPRGGYRIVGFPVNVGDRIGAQVKYIGDHTFRLIISNFTENVYAIIPRFYTKMKAAKRASAGWIVEAPSLENGDLLPLANFGTISFMSCTAIIQGEMGTIKAPHRRYDPITMKTESGLIKSFPSALLEGGTAFTMTWTHD